MEIPSNWQTDKLGSQLTSLQVGGLIKYFVRPKTLAELQEALAVAQALKCRVKCMGGGSNLVMAEEGLEALLIQPQFKQINLLTAEERELYQAQLTQPRLDPVARYRAEKAPGFLNLSLSGEEDGVPREWEYVEMAAGVPWGQAVAVSLQMHLAGLQWFARIPCQVGGAVYNNIHGADHFVSEYVALVKTVDPRTGEQKSYSQPEAKFRYDQSVFHQNGEVISSVVFRLAKVSPAQAVSLQKQYQGWTQQKAQVQPTGANCGSVFQNIPPDKAQSIGQMAVAAAWYIDQAGCKGRQVGDMQVYPGHANFIVNQGQGKPTEFIQLVSEIREAVYDRFGFWLEPEVECIDKEANSILWPKSKSAKNS